MNAKEKTADFLKKHKKIFLPFIIIFLCLFFFPLFFRVLPYRGLEELKNQIYSCRIYDRNGKIIQVTPLKDGSRREWRNIKEFPKELKKEFIKQEDSRFYFHHGVDYFSLAKSFVENQKANKIVRGGSTITMQLAKIISGNSKISLKRKISDIINAYRIEAKLSKNQILELYLNSVYFGNNSFGAASAARTYFSKEPSSLTKEEIQVLSLIPRNPSYYNPLRFPKHFKNLEETALSVKNTVFTYDLNMPHFVFYICSQNMIKKNSCLPVEIRSSADMEIYSMARSSLMSSLEKVKNSRISNGALLLLDNSDSSVLAWIGNGNYFDSESSGQIDGVLVKNHPGSSMKPFLYALGMETPSENTAEENQSIITPSKVMADIPSEFGNEKLYIPENFNNRFNGPVLMRTALGSSLNVPAVSALNEIGVKNYIDFLGQLGFESVLENGKKADLGLALGACEVSLNELVPAFSTFVHDGIFIPYKIQEKAIWRTGKLERAWKKQAEKSKDKNIEKNHTENGKGKKIFSSDTARIICSILSDKSSRSLGFGYSQTFQTSYPSIFKTGTSNQYQDIVALGATKDFTIGVWMGNFSGETVIGKTGSSFPAWCAKSILDRLEKGKDPSLLEFKEPEHYHKRKICSLSGMDAGKYCSSTIYEYIKDGKVLQECNWHVNKNGEVSIVYPAVYQEWALTKNEENIIEYSQGELEIISPKNDSIFYFSMAHEKDQSISVQVTGGNEKTLLIKYDGKILSEIKRPFVFDLPVEKGDHKLSVKCGNEEKEIEFSVK